MRSPCYLFPVEYTLNPTDMTIQQFADYYLERGIFSCSSRKIDFVKWSNIDIAIKTFNAQKWNTEGKYLFGIAGVKGIRCIEIKVDGLEEENIDFFIKFVLKALFNDEYYPWVIRRIDIIYIVVDCGFVSSGEFYSYNNITLLLRTSFPLPVDSNDMDNFYFKAMPVEHPTPISHDKLYKVVEDADKLLTSLKSNKKPHIPKDIAYLGSQEHFDKVNAKRLGLSVSDYKKFQQKEEALLNDFKNHINRKKENKRKRLIGITITVGLLLLIGLICSSGFRMVFLAFILSIVVAGAIYIILNDPIDSFIKVFRETPKGERGKLILAFVVTILLYILFYGGILIGLYAFA